MNTVTLKRRIHNPICTTNWQISPIKMDTITCLVLLVFIAGWSYRSLIECSSRGFDIRVHRQTFYLIQYDPGNLRKLGTIAGMIALTLVLRATFQYVRNFSPETYKGNTYSVLYNTYCRHQSLEYIEEIGKFVVSVIFFL